MKRKVGTKNTFIGFLCGMISAYFGCDLSGKFFSRPTVVQSEAIECTVGFSPKGPCTNLIVGKINAAEKEILVQAYHITSLPIIEALIRAKKRGLVVKILLDKAMTKDLGIISQFRKARIAIAVDSKVAIAHNKVIIIDQSAVITGSFNFTNAAQHKNAENMLVIRSKELAKVYRDNWFLRFKESELL